MDKNVHTGHRERMKERYYNDLELENFSTHEMIELLLFCGVPLKNTNTIAHDLEETFGSFSNVFYASPDELKKVPNMTSNASLLLSAVMPVARWVEVKRKQENVKVSTMKEAKKILLPYFKNRRIEYVYMASIDINDRLIGVNVISKGSPSYSPLDIRDIIMIAVHNGASKVVLAHNHPNGALGPSDEDLLTTTSILFALNAIGVSLSDHLIFSEKGIFSFYENNIIQSYLQNCDELCGTDYFHEHALRKVYPGERTKYSEYFNETAEKNAHKEGSVVEEYMRNSKYAEICANRIREQRKHDLKNVLDNSPDLCEIAGEQLCNQMRQWLNNYDEKTDYNVVNDDKDDAELKEFLKNKGVENIKENIDNITNLREFLSQRRTLIDDSDDIVNDDKE